MKQKKIGNILYVYSTTAYEITEDTDATVIKIQEECIPAYTALNASLVSKFSPINYKLFCVKQPEWADYLNDYTVTVGTITGGTVTATPNSGDEGEEITLSQTASTGYEFTAWDVEDADGTAITVTNNKFTMPGKNVTVGATFDKIDFDITVDNTIQNGTLSAPATANLGDTVTITVTPATNYKLDTLTVMCGSLEVTVINNQFTMPAGDVTITGTFIIDVIPYEQQYFTIESEADNNDISITLYGSNPDSTQRNTFSVSSDDGTTWTNAEFDEGEYSYSAALSEGDKLLIKSTNTTFSIDTDDSIITSSGNFKAYGNIMSLLYGDNFANQTSFPVGSSKNFSQLFYCTKLTDASNLILPATTLTEECYNSMFYGCHSLTTPPKLPATTVGQRAYFYMFGDTYITELIMLATSINFEYNNLYIPDTNGTAYVNPNADSTIRSYFTGYDWTVVDYVPNV